MDSQFPTVKTVCYYIRGQDVTPEQHITFSRWFGDLKRHVVSQFLLPGHPEILVVSNVKEMPSHRKQSAK